MTFTKEQLIARARFLIKRHQDSLANHPDQDGVAMDLELARMALAGVEAEPAYFINRVKHSDAYGDDVELRVYCYELDAMKSKDDFGGEIVPLYTAPQPLTTSERAELENYRNAQVVPDAYAAEEHRRVIGMLLDVCGAAFELADDSCQQEVEGEDCHVVPDASFIKLSDALDKIETTLPCEYAELPNIILQWAAIPRYALRYMLQGKADGNSPVIPDGWIPVSERMPGSQEWVIVFAKWDNQQVLCWDDVANRWTDFEDQSYYADMFTHWMPLPAAPQQEDIIC